MDSRAKETLGEWLSHVAIQPLIRKRASGGYEVPLGPCILGGSTWIFLKGAVLGAVCSDCLDTLVKMLSITWANPGKEQDLCILLKHVAKERLDNYGREPDSFHMFWLKTEFDKLDLANLDVLQQLSAQNVRLGEILKDLDTWLMHGIGFGATYPELVRKMWEKDYEMPIAPEKSARMREFGLEIPEQQTQLPFEEIKNQVLLEVSCYAREYFPELIDLLKLPDTSDELENSSVHAM
jgi:hypothetical protein